MATNPESLTEGEIKNIKVTTKVKDFVKALNTSVIDAQNDRTAWNDRQDLWIQRRYGIKQPKAFPWPGAANFILPQIDSDINRIKPAYVNLATSVSPIVTFEPFGPEDIEPARLREQLFDWRMRTQVRFFKPYALGIDYMLQYGFVIFKTNWKFKTRKYTDFMDLNDMPEDVVEALFQPEVTDDVLFQIIVEETSPDMTFQENVDEINRNIALFRTGTSKFEFNYIETSEDRAEVIACNPRDEVTFPVETIDINNARFVDYKFWVTKNDIKIAMKDKKYQKYQDDDINSWSSSSNTDNSTAAQLRNIRDGVSSYADASADDDMVLMHEVEGWYDIDGDGIEERVITTYPDSDPSSVLRFIESPYDHGQSQFTVVRRELVDSPIISSRGIPQIDDDFQVGISTIFNQDIDAGTITNTPTIITRTNSVKNLRNLRYIPGQRIEAENGAADVQILQQGNAAQANRFNNMQYLKGWANERIGNVSAAFSSPVNTPGLASGGSKSATEVEAIASHESALQSLDLQVFQDQMAEVYYKLDVLYDQFGNDEETIAITGQEPVRISRREVQGKFNRVPNGRLDDANPSLRLRKLFLLTQTALQMDPEGQIVSKKRLTEFVLKEIDHRVSKMVMLTPEEQQQIAQAQAQAIANQKAQSKQEAIEARVTSDNLDIRKEVILAPIQGKKYATG